jgi:hypothetical protein
MKSYSQYITELFDRKVPFKLSNSGDYAWGYYFVIMYQNGKPTNAPQGKQLEKFVDSWFMKKGIDMGGATREERERQLALFNKEFTAFSYTVGFDHAGIDRLYSELAIMTDGDIKKDVWELSFTMHQSTLKLQTIGRPSVTGRYYWDWDGGTSEDINRFSGADAAMILGAVTDIAMDFVKQKKPRGIILGTKPTANPARGRIYKTIARAAAKKAGGTYHEIDSPREGMVNGVMIWFDESNPFILHGT